MQRKGITNEYLESQIKSHKYQLIEDKILYCIITDVHGYDFTGEAFCKVTEKSEDSSIVARDLAFERALDSMRKPYTFYRSLELKKEKEELEKAHKERVLEELSTLKVKLEKLEKFLMLPEIPIFLTEEHWELLKAQRDTMRTYRDIIEKRLEIF